MLPTILLLQFEKLTLLVSFLELFVLYGLFALHRRPWFYGSRGINDTIENRETSEQPVLQNRFPLWLALSTQTGWVGVVILYENRHTE